MMKDKQKEVRSKIPTPRGSQRPITDHLEKVGMSKHSIDEDYASAAKIKENQVKDSDQAAGVLDSPMEPGQDGKDDPAWGKTSIYPPPRIIPLEPTGSLPDGQGVQAAEGEEQISNKAIMEQLSFMNGRLGSLDLLDSLAKDMAKIGGEYQTVKTQVNTVSNSLNSVKSKVEEHEKELEGLPGQVNREIDFRMNTIRRDMEYEFMIRDTQRRELNLIVDGIYEDPQKTPAIKDENVREKVVL